MQGEQDLCFGPHRLNLRAGQLWRDQESVKLTPKALAVLCLLVTRPGQVVTKDELFQAVWPDVVVGDDALTSCIQELRHALRDDARNPRYIETVHRRGYRFISKVVSDQLSVVSQDGVASSQHSVVSSQEEDKNTEQAEGLRLQAEGPPSSSPSSLSQLSSLDEAQRNPGEESAPESRIALRSIRATKWPSKVFILSTAFLLIGMVLTVHYLSRSTLSPQSSALVTQSLTPNPQPLSLLAKPSIAVMPFTNMSGDPEQEYFSDGLTDDLITDLSRLSQLFVIARHSTFTYKGKAVKVQEVSKELGVRYLLEGSVQKTTEQIRINAQLVDATTGHHLWAERYDRPLQDIFALQNEVVQKIVTTLKLQLTLQEQGVLVRKATNNLEAHDYYLLECCVLDNPLKSLWLYKNR